MLRLNLKARLSSSKRADQGERISFASFVFDSQRFLLNFSEEPKRSGELPSGYSWVLRRIPQRKNSQPKITYSMILWHIEFPTRLRSGYAGGQIFNSKCGISPDLE